MSVRPWGSLGVCVALWALPLVASSQSIPQWHTRGAASAIPMPRSAARGRMGSASCTPQGAGAFNGGGSGNEAGGTDSAVVNGQGNRVCNQLSVIAGGNDNTIFLSGAQQNAEESFIGGGDTNFISSYRDFLGSGQYGIVDDFDAFLGAGLGNLSHKTYAFEGAGAYNDSEGLASFVGAGGAEYYVTQTEEGNQTFSYGNVAKGTDSFLGAGDLNSVAGNGSFVGAGDYLFALEFHTAIGNSVAGNDAFVGAGDLNAVTGNGSFIGAGDYTYASDGGSTAGNQISGVDSFIGAGDQNSVSAQEAFIGSGGVNTIGSTAAYATILGGNRNDVTGEYASILGGFGNTASGTYAIVAGGDSDTAAGILSFAAGYHADAAHNGSFVWSDYTAGSTSIKDTAANQFVARASGGFTLYSNEAATSGVSLAAGSGTWSSLSDRNAKTDIAPLDDDAILEKVAALPVEAWRYKSETAVRHVGPMAQDFYAAFGVGEDDRHITSIDEDGVALSAIKALNVALHRDNARLTTRVAALEGKAAEVSSLRDEVRELETAVASMRSGQAR